MEAILLWNTGDLSPVICDGPVGSPAHLNKVDWLSEVCFREAFCRPDEDNVYIKMKNNH